MPLGVGFGMDVGLWEAKWNHVGIKMKLKMGCSEKAEKSKII